MQHSGSFAQSQSEPIVVSKAAYYALCKMMDKVNLSGKEWQELDAVGGSAGNKANHMKELVEHKGVCERRYITVKGNTIIQLRLLVDFDRVMPSKRLCSVLPDEAYMHPVFSSRLTPEDFPENFSLKKLLNKKPLALNRPSASPIASTTIDAEFTESIPAAKPKQAKPLSISNPELNNPVADGGYKPTFYDLKEFVRRVEAFGEEFVVAQLPQIQSSMQAVKQKLVHTHGREEGELIDQLARLKRQERELSLEALLDAIKGVSADAAFTRFKLDQILSVVPHDYLAQR